MRLFFLLFICIPFQAAAEQLKLDGFATIGLTITDSKTAGVRQHISQPNATYENEFGFTNSSAGGQIEWQANSSTQLVGQVIFKDNQEQNLDNIIQMAFLRYTPNANWQVRFGRTGLDLFMMTEHRDIGYTYTYDHPPTEFYAIVPHQNLDGADIKYTYSFSEGLFSSKFFIGRSTAPIVSDDNFFWDVELKSLFGLVLEWQSYDWTLRANYTATQSGNENEQQKQLRAALAQIPNEIWPQRPALLESLNIIGKRFNYSALGVRYDNSQWFAQSELSYIDSNSQVLKALTAGYASVGFYYNNHTLMTTFAQVKSNNTTPQRPLISSEQLDLLYNTIIRHTNFYLVDQNTLSVTLRTEINDSLAVKVQLEHTAVDSLPSAFYLHRDLEKGNFDNSFNTLGISLNWVF
ncbi:MULTISPECIES: hypothetical protein [Pseudoalteromonas]|uniref:Porin n=1 Tax=Pseudoalteromonas luteoviolacea (strain 2ta16) TaxID=1353533 RepID=V4HYS4_PSEL2|nr:MULTISPECIES: hypothetical protein [Pseudoalteromonas]ESP93099.1 hypothetical protein PL2TA16_03735 [Pseudoalteromonas luteoviolacea 2ta16]KZN31582.1 hypothetical protein N483_27180 [Pseudoalteromonas luteoviolacea NCIMB 1944]MCG7551687.1 hypothetical protein [Pseudoalteromonas sp. Of7M-16]